MYFNWNLVKQLNEKNMIQIAAEQSEMAAQFAVQNIDTEVLKTIGPGDEDSLAYQQITNEYQGDYEGISLSMKKIRTELSLTLSEIYLTAQQVDSGADQVSSGAQAISQGATELTQKNEEVNDLIVQIDTATAVQAETILRITEGLEQISTVVQTNATTAEESSASSEELSTQATMLREKIQRFKIDM